MEEATIVFSIAMFFLFTVIAVTIITHKIGKCDEETENNEHQFEDDFWRKL